MAGGIILVAVLLSGRPAQAASPSEIETSIAAAKKYIYSQQQKNGTWESVDAPKDTTDGNDTAGPQWGGLTALCTHALLSSGENPQDSKLAPAIEFLKKSKLTGTYAIGVRCQVWLLLSQTPEVRGLVKKDAAALQALMKRTKGSPAYGFYDYDGTRGPNAYSLSRSQYAVLGMWAAAQCAVEIPNDYWQTVETAWINAQDKSGGWRYQNGTKTTYALTPGITAVGVATLYITQEYLAAGSGKTCKGNVESPAIDRGLKWMADHFDEVATEQRTPRDFPYATLYAVERIGVASGRKYLGTGDWFKKGADFLLKQQRKEGSWSTGGIVGRLPDTCFGLLFLVRGRAPLVMSKLEYRQPDGAESDWNQRPRDAANLSRWIGRRLERDLSWQIVNPQSPLADWHDAPILYIAGTKEVKFDEPTKAKLKPFAEEGGLILGNADCGGRAFVNSFRKLGASLFPSYEFRELPADHPIYHGLFARDKWKSKPSVLGLSNGVRELMLLLPQADAGRVWQSQEVGGKEEPWQLGADLFMYLTDARNLRYRGESTWVAADTTIKTTTKISVARIQYEGNWNPEPAGWRRFSNVMARDKKLELTTQVVKSGADVPQGCSIAHVTGTAAFKLGEPTRAAIKRFVTTGGTLIIDAAGGSSSFAGAAEAEIAAIFSDAKLEKLPADHPVFSAGGAPPGVLKFRTPVKGKGASAPAVPRLWGLTIDGRIGVFFSRDDISAGLVGQTVEGVIGYEPDSATEILSRMVLFATRSTHP